MPKYIDADALVDSLCRVAKSLSDDGAPAAAGCVAGTILYITSFPAADVIPAKRGKWLPESRSRYCCTACNCGTDNPSLYCSYCGAKMA